jgi:hypothetical protein
MKILSWKFNRRGMGQLQDNLSDGLEAVADRVLDGAVSRAPVGPSGQTRATLHTDKTHSHEWPQAAVFVATASGDGFFVHEGTVDTPPHPFLSEALDSIIRDIPGIMRKESKGREFGIFRR